MKPRLIGLAGPAQAGKSTASELLGIMGGYVRVRFADPIKKALAAILEASGMPEEFIWRHLDGDLKEEPLEALSGRSARFAMQTMGTEWGREIMHPDLWVNITMARVRKLLAAGEYVAIDDVRFWEEMGAVRTLGGTTIEITRRGTFYRKNHRSEDGLSGFDHTIDNSGTQAGLAHKLQQIIGGS
jgi:hypothetical protein